MDSSETNETSETVSDTAGETNEEELTDETQGGFTVALSINNLDEYQAGMTTCLELELEERGGVLESYNAEGTVEKQLADVESIIQTNPDVIVIESVDPEGTAVAVRTAHESGIPTVVFQLNVNVTEDDYDAMVNKSDDQIRGKVQAEWLMNYMDEHPDEKLYVGSLMGAPNGGSVGYQGFITLYEQEEYKDRVQEIISLDCNWTQENAMKATEDWLIAHPEINVFQAENDMMAQGAVQAIKNMGKDPSDYIVMGMNGDIPAQELIKAGEMAMTAGTSKRDYAEICAEVCARLAAGERFAEGEKFFDATEAFKYPMDITNIEELLASGKFDY